VVDDPHRGRAPWTIDDEGTCPRPIVLIEGGRTTGVLHDLTTARAAGAESTGHGRRGSYLDRVLPRLGCTYVAGGNDDPLSILESTRSGVFLRRIVAANVDPITGAGMFLVTDADAIEQGRLTYPLEPFPIVIDIDESLPSLDAIGDDLAFDRCVGSCVRDGQPVAVSVGAPTIRLGVIKALL
jgi:TldD protein